MEKYAIIVVGYNRPLSIAMLLDSVNKAEYSGTNVDLIISIDKGERQNEITIIADSFEWIHGNKIVIKHENKLGLKEHILRCGDFSQLYDLIFLLEDDLTVSTAFFTFGKQAAEFYAGDNKIAGISLYKHLTNVNVSRPFIAGNNGYDSFFMQFAQSWGQCWTRQMWNGFRNWYMANNAPFYESDYLPKNILLWNHKSWLKYYMKYIVETDKYFVYPQISLTTNHSEVGTHCNESNNDYQVPLLEKSKIFSFPSFEQGIKYDVFFERVDPIMETSMIFQKKCCIDLYGTKFFFEGDILISTALHPYEIIKKIRILFRPHEINLVNPIDGNDIFVYDLSKIAKKTTHQKKYPEIRFDIGALSWKSTLLHGLTGLFIAIKRKFSKKAN